METRNINDRYEVPQTRDSIPSTWLAKRRGDTATAELKKGLRTVILSPKDSMKWTVVNGPGVENLAKTRCSPVQYDLQWRTKIYTMN